MVSIGYAGVVVMVLIKDHGHYRGHGHGQSGGGGGGDFSKIISCFASCFFQEILY